MIAKRSKTKKTLIPKRQVEKRDDEGIKNRVGEAWEEASERLDQISRLSRENDIRLVLVFIPHRSQVHLGLPADAHIISDYFSDLDRRLENYCCEKDICFVNLLPYFVEGAYKGETLYYQESDAHWNPNGHKYAAMAIYDFLIQEVFNNEAKGEATR